MNQTISTRERVLEFIKQEGSVSVKILTEAIGITPMAIRGHLTKLEKEELIEVQNVRQKLGRPLQVFALTKKGEDTFPKAYDTFALELIEDIKSLDDGATFKKVLLKREERLQTTLSSELESSKTPLEKMQRYVTLIEAQGNMPSMTQVDDKQFKLKVANCSIFNIAAQHHFCCESEIKVIENIFPEAKISREKVVEGSETGCVYMFKF